MLVHLKLWLELFVDHGSENDVFDVPHEQAVQFLHSGRAPCSLLHSAGVLDTRYLIIDE